MKPKLASVLAIVLTVALILSGCTQPPAGTPQPTQAAAQPTAAPQQPAAKAKYVIATDAAFPPMEFVDENKNIVGFDIDLMNAIAKVMGFEVEFKNTAWDGIFAGLESGDYDAILSAVTITDERKAKYDFSDPYINAGQAVVVRADETAIQSHQDLPGKTVGAQIGTTGALAVQEMQGVTLKEYDTIDLALLDLVSGNLDAVVVDTPVAADYALASEQFKGKLKIVGEPFTDEWYGLVVRKGENADLLKAFNEGLKKIKADGTYDKIYAKWIAGEGVAPVAAAPAVAPVPGFPVKIAIVVPLSGDVKTFGESTRDRA
ncbi:MAG: basic amino acid ABC transporter substrate-binding protein, partial [Chloroflexi bacterium]|nr:basic amino acid ABC transporter substrate-binding protein [Chloroflexota bacterium]